MRSLRLLMIAVLAAVCVSALPAYSSSETRIGVGFGIPNYVLIYQPGNFDFRGGYDLTTGSEFIYLSGGYRFVDRRRLNGPLHLSLGIGAYGKLLFDSSGSEGRVIGGLNLPVGVSLLFFDRFVELFAEVAPGIDLYPRPGFADVPLQMWAGISLQID